jgi:putative transposase
MALARLWKGWRGVLFVVHPDTVVRWQRERFRRYWTQLSNPGGKPGRPPIGRQIQELIRTLAKANPLWCAPRIHGELRKLGIKVSERTVSRILAIVKRPPSQTWRTFLKNHVGGIVATDIFTVPTVGLRVLFVFLVFAHERRRVLHFGITEHPTSQWVGQQVVEAFADTDAARYLVRDRDGAYGDEFRRRVQSLGTQEILIAPRSPWQNAFVERLIGSIRRECLNHVVVLKSTTPAQDTEELLRLLPRVADTFGIGKGCSRTARDHEPRKDRRHSTGRWFAPSL